MPTHTARHCTCQEFYEYGLVSGIHYVAVDTAEDVPAMVRWLREHDDYARAVAQAGRARMSSLDVKVRHRRHTPQRTGAARCAS